MSELTFTSSSRQGHWMQLGHGCADCLQSTHRDGDAMVLVEAL